MEFMWFSSWRMRHCPRWWKVPPGLFLTFCFLLQNRTYKMNIISLSKAFFFFLLFFLEKPLFSFTLESSPSETWKSCRSTGVLWVLSPAALNPSFSVSLTHTLTYIFSFFASFLCLTLKKKKKKTSWGFRGSLVFSLHLQWAAWNP